MEERRTGLNMLLSLFCYDGDDVDKCLAWFNKDVSQSVSD